jgi:hypothetical protein
VYRDGKKRTHLTRFPQLDLLLPDMLPNKRVDPVSHRPVVALPPSERPEVDLGVQERHGDAVEELRSARNGGKGRRVAVSCFEAGERGRKCSLYVSAHPRHTCDAPKKLPREFHRVLMRRTGRTGVLCNAKEGACTGSREVAEVTGVVPSRSERNERNTKRRKEEEEESRRRQRPMLVLSTV